jgi:hypothetical protein
VLFAGLASGVCGNTGLGASRAQLAVLFWGRRCWPNPPSAGRAAQHSSFRWTGASPVFSTCAVVTLVLARAVKEHVLVPPAAQGVIRIRFDLTPCRH